MPRPPKPTHIRQNRERRDLGVIQGGAELEVPEAPKGMLSVSKSSWLRFWESDLGQSPAIKRDTDLSVIERLWGLYDERERAYREYKKARLVKGSQGQMVMNPMGRVWTQLDPSILALEDRIGLSPMARLKLGITFGQAHASLEEMNRRMNDDSDSEQDPRNDDPRIIDVASS
jgi:P27 family predicted phage terminase small subunit